MTSLSDDVLE